MAASPDLPLEQRRHPYTADATPEDIRACFRLLLGRNPNPEEWTGHLGLAGQPLSTVVANYVNSLEFAGRGLLVRPAPAVSCADCGEYRIYASPEDQAVGRHALAGVYDPHIAGIIRQVLRPGMGMMDIGANIGVFALLGAALVGPAGYVLAIEPNPANTRLLEASRRLNGFDQLRVCQAAAGSTVGLLALHAFDSNGTTSAIPTDALLTSGPAVGALPAGALVPAGQRIDLIKIDVEGAEYLALRGCEAILRSSRPVIVSEFSPSQLAGISGLDGVAYINWLVGLGYRVGVVGQDGAVSPPGTDAGAVMARYHAAGVDHIDIVCLPAGAELGVPG